MHKSETTCKGSLLFSILHLMFMNILQIILDYYFINIFLEKFQDIHILAFYFWSVKNWSRHKGHDGNSREKQKTFQRMFTYSPIPSVPKALQVYSYMLALKVFPPPKWSRNNTSPPHITCLPISSSLRIQTKILTLNLPRTFLHPSFSTKGRRSKEGWNKRYGVGICNIKNFWENERWSLLT